MCSLLVQVRAEMEIPCNSITRSVCFTLSAAPRGKANKDIPDTCGDLILCVKCINIEITKAALCLSSKEIELYLSISAEKEYPTRTGVGEAHFLEKQEQRLL